MTPISKKHDDTRILLAVAGAVVAGAAGLALLAGLGSGEPDDGEGRVAGASAAARVATPARTPRPAPSVDAGQGTIETAAFTRPGAPGPSREPALELAPEVAPNREAGFRIEPGEDLIAGALAAWNGREYGRAAAYFEAQTQARDTDAWAHYMLGLSRWKADLAPQAVAALERAEELAPDFVRAPLNLARIQNDRGEYEAALVASRRALAIEPGNAEARFLEGRSLNNLGLTDEAVAALEQSIADDPDNGYVHNLLGLILLQQGEAERAAQTLARAAELQPGVAFIQNNLGMAAERSGDREAAIVAYRRAVDLDSAHTRAARNLARLQPLQPSEPETAEATVAGVVAPAEGEGTEGLN